MASCSFNPLSSKPLIVLSSFVPIKDGKQVSYIDMLDSSEMPVNLNVTGEISGSYDRAYEAVIYPHPVHYDYNGKWVDIDNTLVEDKDSVGNSVYRNTANEFRAEFSNAYTEKVNLVSITRKGYSIGFNFVDLGRGSKAEIKNSGYDAAKDSKERDMQMCFPAQLSSEITYDRVADNKSLTYKITPTGVTELIELGNPKGAEQFTTILRASSRLSTIVNMDGSIDFADGDDIIFKLDAPYMYDASNAISTNIKVEFKINDEQTDIETTAYTYRIIPDYEWLTAKDRVYPVVIDPTITTSFESANIIETSVSSYLYNQVNQSVHPGTLKVGYGTSSGNNKMYIRFKSLPALTSGDMVISSVLHMGRKNSNSSSGDQLNLYQVYKSWTSSSLTWSNQPTTDFSSPVKSVAFATTAGSYNKIKKVETITGPLQPCSCRPIRQARMPWVRTVCSSLMALMSLSCFSCFKNHLCTAKTAPKTTPRAVIVAARVVRSIALSSISF